MAADGYRAQPSRWSRPDDGTRVPLGPVLAAGLACCVLGAAIAFLGRDGIDRPVVLFLNHFAGWPARLQEVLAAPFRLEVLAGPLFIAVIWFVWFDTKDDERRARLAAGVIGASIAGLASRSLQLALPTHPRPLHDAALIFTPPPWVDPDLLSRWNSFPSDHAALLCGLAGVAFLFRPAIGTVALVWALLINLTRVYEGLHFLSDVIGGAGLGIVVVCLSQHPVLWTACLRFARWARSAPGIFYGSAFLVTYEVSELFEDVREVGHGLSQLLLK